MFFKSLLRPPALTKNCLELLSYLAYDRVGCVVELANKERHGGVLTASQVPLSLAEIEAAVAALPIVPDELRLAELRLSNAEREQVLTLT